MKATNQVLLELGYTHQRGPYNAVSSIIGVGHDDSFEGFGGLGFWVYAFPLEVELNGEILSFLFGRGNDTD